MLFCGFLSGAGVKQYTSTFWTTTQQPDMIQQATLPHLKEGSQGFHLSPKTAIIISDFIDKTTKRHLYWNAPRT